MALFNYVAKRLSTDKTEKGQIEAENLAEANRKIRSTGHLVLKLEPIGQGGNLKLSFSFKRVSLKEKVIFTRQLSVMLKAGLPMVRCLESLQKQTESTYFKEVIASLITDVKGGQTLSKALLKFPKVFPDIYTAVVQAGEQSGQLAEVLLELSDQQEKEADLISKVKGAMIYPGVILCALIGVVIIIVVFVLPTLQTVFTESGVALPLQTRFLLAISNFTRRYFYLYIPIFALLIWGSRFYFKTQAGQSFYDRIKVKLPIFGALTKKLYMARFSRTLALLSKASFPILKSIQIVKKTINNVHYQAAFGRIEQQIEGGKPLSLAIDREKLFPPMVSQLTNLGEESGTLDAVLTEIANFYDKEVEQLTKNLTTLLEPILMLVMGIGVAFVVASVLGPIYGLVQGIG